MPVDSSTTKSRRARRTPDHEVDIDLVELERPHPDALLTPGEVARYFRVSPKTVSRWGESGRIAMSRTKGGHRRFQAKAVFELLEGEG